MTQDSRKHRGCQNQLSIWIRLVPCRSSPPTMTLGKTKNVLGRGQCKISKKPIFYQLLCFSSFKRNLSGRSIQNIPVDTVSIAETKHQQQCYSPNWCVYLKALEAGEVYDHPKPFPGSFLMAIEPTYRGLTRKGLLKRLTQNTN